MQTKLNRKRMVTLEEHERILKRIFQYFCEIPIGLVVGWMLGELGASTAQMYIQGIMICYILNESMGRYRREKERQKGEVGLYNNSASHFHKVMRSKTLENILTAIAYAIYFVPAIGSGSLEILVWSILFLLFMPYFVKYLKQMAEEEII